MGSRTCRKFSDVVYLFSGLAEPKRERDRGGHGKGETEVAEAVAHF